MHLLPFTIKAAQWTISEATPGVPSQIVQSTALSTLYELAIKGPADGRAEVSQVGVAQRQFAKAPLLHCNMRGRTRPWSVDDFTDDDPPPISEWFHDHHRHAGRSDGARNIQQAESYSLDLASRVFSALC